MCHGDDSRPPAPPRAGAVADAGDLHLRSADGTRLMAYGARPAQPRGQGMVILPDFRGLHEFYKALARRLAESGVAALAIDYFGRSMPDGPRTEPPAEMFPRVGELMPEQVAADTRAAVDHLLAGHLGPVDAAFSLGFCFGGSQSWNQSAFDDRLAGCVGFYGVPADCRPFVDRMRVPLLLLVGSADQLTPVEDFERFDGELSEAGVDRTMVVYDGAPHAFFDGAGGHEEACGDAWRRVLEFADERSPERSRA